MQRALSAGTGGPALRATRLLLTPLLLALCAVLLPPSAARAQQPPSDLEAAARAIEEAETPEAEADALIDYAHILNRATRYAEALDAISEAAQTVGIPAAPEVRPAALPDDSERTRLILLHRGIAHEGLNQYPEARNDYEAFLALEDTSQAAALLTERRDYIDIEATQSLTTLARIDSEQLARFYDPEGSRYGVTIFPFHNVSETLFLTQIGYGLYGYLSTALSLLDTFTDQPFRVTERYRINAALDEVSLGPFYAASAPIAPPKIALNFGSDVAVTGTVNADPSGLLVETRLASLSRDTVFALEDARSLTSDPEGIIGLQITLVLQMADALQDLTGFEYLSDRSAFEDSIRALAVGDFQRLFAYGRSVELSIVGDLQNAATGLTNANVNANLTREETAVQQRTLQAQQAPRVSVADVLGAARGRRSTPRPTPVDLPVAEDPTPPVVEPAPPPRTRTDPSLGTAARDFGRMLTLTGQTSLGAFGIDDATTGVSTPSARSQDPRDPVEGALRTQQGQVTIRIRIPVPPVVPGRRTP